MQLQAGRRIAVLVNGERTGDGAASLGELVAQLGFTEGQVATALNGDFVPRTGARRRRACPGRQGRDRVVAPRQGG
jgi:sulfur carrier protein ThiS